MCNLTIRSHLRNMSPGDAFGSVFPPSSSFAPSWRQYGQNSKVSIVCDSALKRVCFIILSIGLLRHTGHLIRNISMTKPNRPTTMIRLGHHSTVAKPITRSNNRTAAMRIRTMEVQNLPSCPVRFSHDLFSTLISISRCSSSE